MPDDPIRIAFWSGPRNLSTALMRSWGNRPDTAVTDEPLYGSYLQMTGIDHPGRAEVIAAQETDWRKVIAALTGPSPGGKPVWYQKHMAHHLLPEIPRDWIDGLANGFLIRDPARVLASYAKVRTRVSLSDLGLVQQLELVERIVDRTGRTPPVVDADDLLRAPAEILRALTTAFGLAFTDAMLEWPPGPRASDGVWARYWYASVEKSTGFAPYRETAFEVPPDLRSLYSECLPYYRKLHEIRITGQP